MAEVGESPAPEKRGGIFGMFGGGKKADDQESEPPTPPASGNPNGGMPESPGASPMSADDDKRYPRVDPNQLTLIEGIEHKMESIMAKDVRVYLWVDINGLKIVDAKSRHVQWSARLNTIVQWAVRDDYFWCRMIYKKGEQRERGFLTGYSKAVKLKAAMETFVNIHLKDAELARQLMMLADDPQQGGTIKESMLKDVEPLESGQYRDPALVTKYLPKKRHVSTIEHAPLAKGAADMLPENAPPPWVMLNSDSSTFNEDVKALQRQNEQMRMEYDNQQTQMQVLKVEVERLSKQLNEAYAAGGDGAGEQVGRLMSENSRLEMRCKELERQAQSAGAGNGNPLAPPSDEAAKIWQDQKEVLEEMMEEKMKLAESLQGEVESLQAENTSLKSQLASEQEAKLSLQQASEGGSEMAKVLQEQLTQAQQELAAMGATEAQTAERAALRARALAHALSGLQQQAAGLKAENKALKKQQAELIAAMPGMLNDVQAQVTQYVESQASGLEEMKTLYQNEMALRKKLHNELVDLKGNIRVYCRVRPLLNGEGGDNEDGPIIRYPIGDEKISVKAEKREDKTFTYERVFRPEEDQIVVFKEIEALITSVMDGYNVTIFAYGQTGSGKTHTMAGPKDNPGVNIRALKELFQVAQQRSGDFTTIISAAYLEIYNENIYDLLADRPKENALDVKFSGADGIEVQGLVKMQVGSVDDVQRIIDGGNSKRSTFATNMNEHSSRSHSMLSIYITSTNVHTNQTIRGKIHLVDLAGSERLSRTDASGDRLKEAQAINKSLSALGDVIAALAKRDKHVPFRNSKLTQCLQDSMEGTAKVAMFVNVSPTVESANETKCSLDFAQRVRGVELGNANAKVRPQTARK